MSALLVTGANGHLGRRLIRSLPPDTPIEAVVRSERARRLIERHCGTRPGLAVTVTDPADASALAPLAARCSRAAHLIGTIRESRDNPYQASHQRPARALVEAAATAGLQQIVYVSILGADPHSVCHCLRARAEVEALLAAAPVPATLLRVPMVLGEGDRASGALARRAAARRVVLFRGASLEQPIYAGDVIAALTAALGETPPRDRLLELAGPESLSRRELVARAAALTGARPAMLSLPLALGMLMAGLMELTQARPPITRDMLRVLDHDDAIDPAAAAQTLGITLTPLDEMLRRCVGERPAQDATV